MSDLILISILSNLKTFFIVSCVILIIVLMIFGIITLDEKLYGSEEDIKTAKNKLTIFAILTAICLIGSTLLPNKKETYLIYGFGSVIDYVDNNETAKELPDKVIDIVNNYLTKQDSILKLNK